MLRIEFFIGVILLGIVNCANTGKGASLYKDGDNVEYLNVDNYKKIYNSDRAAFVEFYSHWCGACQRYSKHWKKLAAETKNWHSSVIRMSAINCADPDNTKVCNDYNIQAYPTLKLVPAYAKYENKDHDAKFVQTQENEVLIKEMIQFLENHSTKPKQWPELSSYKSNSLNDTFTNNQKMSLIVFEEKESQLGINLILDFSSQKHLVPIHRTNSKDNEKLITDLKVTKFPTVFLIKNNNAKTIEKFELKTVNDLMINKSDQLDEKDLAGIESKEMYSKLIERLLIHLKPQVENVIKPINIAVNSTKLPVTLNNQIDRQSYLTNMDNRIFMHDLESGLSLMLRNDIASHKYLTGTKLSSIKEILRILVKFFPGRKPVRNYLSRLYDSVKRKNTITSLEWKKLTDFEEPSAYLPKVTEWKHCKGSTEIFRGYPCSLWTMFHVLTVSQVELEKTKQQAYVQDFNIEEVINAIRLFVLNFFTCKECSQNFELETKEFKSHLSQNDPNSAVIYFWKVHNTVNKRLEKDLTTDPAHPKIQFPSKSQCPQCYKSNVDPNTAKVYESQFDLKEVASYLISFYSKFQIEGVMELEEKNNIIPIKELTIKESEAQYLKSEGTNHVLVNLSIFGVIITVLGMLYVFHGFTSKRKRVKAHII